MMKHTTTYLIFLALAVSAVYCTLGSLEDVPADWADRVAAGQMLFSVDEPAESLNTYVGNGYIATTIGSDTEYISGVFNGLNTQAPSHRARIPGTSSISIPNVSAKIGSALDIERGVFYRRSMLDSVFIEQRWYAHQVIRNLLVHEIFISNPSITIAEVQLSLNLGAPSTDISFTSTDLGYGVALSGGIVTPEEPGGEVVSVGLVYTTVPDTLTISAETNTTVYFITSAITSLDSSSPLTDALDIFKSAIANEQNLLAEHEAAWANIWTSGMEVSGDLHLAQVINTSLYYILSSVRADWPYSLSPGGLASNGYNGHTFWDCETWMYPSLLLFYPSLAESVLQYRYDRIAGAELKAQSEGYKGVMFPWESAFTGQECCPVSAPTGQLEQHISGDIAFAVRQYYVTTQNVTWLKQVGYPIVSGVADFWLSRVVLQQSTNMYVINGVIPPDEYAVNVNNSVYTNYVAKLSLEFAAVAAQIVAANPNPEWSVYAAHMYIPFNTTTNIHPEFDGYHGQEIKQADVVLLPYPLLMPLTTEVHYNDLVYYEARTDPNGPAMTYGMHAVSWLALGYIENATALFARSYANAQQPFGVWTETPTGGTTNFITGAGGFLQAVWAGYGGVRILEDGLVFNPRLPANVTYMKLRQFQYLSSYIDLSLDTSITVTIQSQESGAPALNVVGSQNKTYPLTVGQPLVLPAGEYKIVQ